MMTDTQKRALYDLIEAVELTHCVDGLPADLQNAVSTLEDLCAEGNLQVPATNVYDYFVQQLGYVPNDETLRDLPVDTVCGADCTQAIDAALAFYKLTAKAVGHQYQSEIAKICAHTVGVYWR